MDFSFTRLRGLVRSIVTRQRAGRAVHSIVRRFEPIIRRIEKGVYPLTSAERLDAGHVARVIEGVIGRSIARVVFVSESCPIPKPEWMTDENYRYICRNTDIRQNIGETLASCLRERSKYDGDGIPFANVGVGIIAGVSESLSHSRLASIGACVFFFGRAAVFGDKDDLRRLGDLIELLPKAIPLGEKKDEDGVWLVLSA